MFNKWLLASVCLSAFINSAQAVNSVDLKVAGTLKSGTCTPSLENGGVVDFGHIPINDLSKTTTNQLGSKNITLTVNCDSAMLIAWTITDNRSDSWQTNMIIKNGGTNGTLDITAGSNQFGLGKTASGANIGVYSVAVRTGSTTTDGINSDLLYWTFGAGANETWVPSTTGVTVNGINGNHRAETMATPGAGSTTPLAGKVFVYPLYVTAAIQGTDVLAISDNTNLDGSATIELVYI